MTEETKPNPHSARYSNALGQTVINPDHVNYYTKGEV